MLTWENKIEKEYKKKSERGVSAILSDEDVYMFLLLEEWEPDLIDRLRKKPDLLKTLWEKLADDEELYHFFCNRVRHFLIECADFTQKR